MARRRNWGNYWAYDGQSALYGARELLPDTREGETVIITVKRQGTSLPQRDMCDDGH